MVKVKLIQVHPGTYCHECGTNSSWVGEVTDWEEIEDNKLYELQLAVGDYNRRINDYKVIIARYDEKITTKTILKNWLINQEKQQKQYEEAERKRKEAKEKKQKEQLAKKANKLKKQYEEALAAGLIK